MYADAPFGVHENPGMQSSVAVSGHVPAISLEAVKN